MLRKGLGLRYEIAKLVGVTRNTLTKFFHESTTCVIRSSGQHGHCPSSQRCPAESRSRLLRPILPLAIEHSGTRIPTDMLSQVNFREKNDRLLDLLTQARPRSRICGLWFSQIQSDHGESHLDFKTAFVVAASVGPAAQAKSEKGELGKTLVFANTKAVVERSVWYFRGPVESSFSAKRPAQNTCDDIVWILNDGGVKAQPLHGGGIREWNKV